VKHLGSLWKTSTTATALFLSLALTGCALWPQQQTKTSNTLLPSKAVLNFGTVGVGGSEVLSDSIQNVTGSVIEINQISSPDPEFKINAPGNFPFYTFPGQSFDLVVTFHPKIAGRHSTVISMVSSASTTNLPISATAAATGTGQITPSAPSISFGNVQVGHNQTRAESVTNSGSATITIFRADVTGNGFSVQNLSLPMNLGAGQNATFNVSFVPQLTGTTSGNLALTSDASNPQLNVPLTGSGVLPGQLTASPAGLGFGNVVTGTIRTLSETLTNSGGSNVTVSQATLTGAGFSLGTLSLPLTLTPGQSVSFNVSLSPAVTGAMNGDISITSDAVNSTVDVLLSGTGVSPGQLSAIPANINFGSVQLGATQTLSETLTNIGGSGITVTQASVTGAGFSITGLTLPTTLAPAQSISLSVKFSPAATGTFSGQVTFSSNASNPTLAVPLSGTAPAPGQLSANPSSIGFGNVLVGNSQSAFVTLTNSGGSDITISQAVASGTGFSLSGLSVPITLAAGQSTSFTAGFAPTLAGNLTGSIAITSNAPNPTLSIPLSGAGVTPGQLSVSPASLSFGNVQVGNSQGLSETLSNTGGSNLTITQVTATGIGFSASGLTLPTTLGPSQTTTFTVSFSPAAAGGATGNIAIVSSVSSANVPLSGTGVTPGQLTPSPVSLSFGSVQTNSNKTLSETLTNSGGASVTISQVSANGAGFSVSGISVPLTLAGGQSTSFSVKFSPSTAGIATGNVTITSNASNSTLNVGLSATGVVPGTLSANPSSVSFGNVQIGSTGSVTETLTNSGGSSLTISNATVTGAAFGVSGLSLPLSLAAGQSTTFTVTFTPTSAGNATGTLALTSDASNPTLNLALSGTGVTPGTLTANPASLSFGNVQTGNSKTLSETLTNSGGTTVNVSSASVNGTGFSISGITPPFSLTSGQSLTFSVTYAPATTGTATGTVAIVSDASNPNLSVTITGTATAPGQLAVTPSNINFGNVVVGTSQQQTGTLSATGASVTVTSVGISGSDFSVSGISFPTTIPAGDSASFAIKFAPAATGATSANVSFASNASNAPTVQSVSGTGTAPPQHSVTLNWTASTSNNVTGYNVYRGTSSGGPYTQINSALDTTTTYVDNTVQGGQTYFYVVTAVNSNNQESAYSNEVKAVIPFP
jgi:hypothetical protein